MNSMTALVPVLPLVTFFANYFFFRRNRQVAPLVATLGVGAAFLLSLSLAAQVMGHPEAVVDKIKWLEVSNSVFGHFTIEVGALLDPLCAMMLVVVTGVSTLVHIYSIGYMHEEPGIARFFMYLGLFTVSMLGLVISPSLYQMYIFWELVGLCSYLLIGFYYTKPEANNACKKAFVVNRVGDFGMFLGILFLSYYLGTVDFQELPAKMGQWPLFGPDWLPLGVVALLLFCGAVGKSAQFPLHVWLPDAMEGPTPVSALIHAATMVAAGVYMVTRVYFVFDAALLSSVNAPQVVAWVGGITSLMAATIAITQFDIKRVLAYSTLSQLGYMIMALGVGGLGVTAGTFHLFTHAFFKALMFLGAGSVIHAMHSNDIRSMGGLRRKMPITAITFLVGCIAIAGIPPFAGFFSKDEILLALKEAHQMPLFYLASSVAFMTAFYMFRLYFITFEGSEPARGHPHESPLTMTGPLMVLAVLSLCAGWTSLPEGKSFGDYIHFKRSATLSSDWNKADALAKTNPSAVGDYVAASKLWSAAATSAPVAEAHASEQEASHEGAHESHAFKLDMSVAVPATLIGLAGILLAFLVYRRKIIDPAKVVKALGPVYTVVYNKYYIDEFYRFVLDKIYFVLSAAIAWFDRAVVDGVMNGLATGAQGAGSVLRRLQNGQLQVYALVMLAGLTLILILIKNGLI